ncbi:MAG: ATP-binding protein [Chloroflexota bacterium]|nr:ATP-binding protein [Chloroflexota bacterium]
MTDSTPLYTHLWHSWTEPFRRIEDDSERHHARVVAGFSGAVLAISVIMIAFTLPVLSLIPDAQLLPQFLALLLFTIPYLVARAGHVKTAIILHTLMALLNVFMGAITLGGTTGISVLYFAVTVSIYAATFLTIPVAILIAVAASVGMLFMSPALNVPLRDILFGPVMFMFGGTFFFLLITLYWRQREALRQATVIHSENRYRLMSELTSDYMFSVRFDAGGQRVIEWVTPSVEKVTGFKPDEILQKTDSIIHPDDLSRVLEDRQKVMEGQAGDAEYRFYRKNQVLRWVQMRRYPQWNEAHTQVIGYYGAVRDITERKQAEHERLETTLQREQYTMVHQLVSAMSHDFRNRLATIETSRYLIERILNAKADERITARMETIRLITNQMITQLDNLSLLAGLGESNPRPTELNYTCRFLHGQFESRVKAAGLHLALEVAEADIKIALDAVQFERAVSQLINNAIDHTAEGGQIIMRTRHDPHDAMLEVEDTGTGIPPDKLADIFQAFYKVSAARTISDSGLGLGLAIVKRIIEGHQGTIEVESEPGKGSLFRIRLPLLTDKTDHANPVQPTASSV